MKGDIHLEPTPEGLRVRYRMMVCGYVKCFNSGYLEREAIAELLNIDDRVREISIKEKER